jgi:hypothetical protein
MGKTGVANPQGNGHRETVKKVAVGAICSARVLRVEWPSLFLAIS